MGTPDCGCIATFSITPNLHVNVVSLFLRADLTASSISLMLCTIVLPMDIGKECRRVERQRGIRAAGVDGAQSVSCSRWPISSFSWNSRPRVGCCPRVDISMASTSSNGSVPNVIWNGGSTIVVIFLIMAMTSSVVSY